jgi:hypothetical protein
VLILQPTVNRRASEKQGQLCRQQHYSLTGLHSCYVSTHESGFLEGFRRWTGYILATQRNPELQGSRSSVFQTGVNTKFLQTSTCYATPLWVVWLFKWLTEWPLYGSFGIKGLNPNIPTNIIFLGGVSWFVGHSVSQITPSRTQDSSHSVGTHNYSQHLTALHFSITEFYI